MGPDTARSILLEELGRLGVSPPGEDFWPGLFYFLARFEKEAPALNLTACKDMKDLLLGPVAEALFLAHRLPQGALCVDLGSGAGIPGLIVKLARKDLTLYLIEAVKKRVAFMNQVIASLGLRGVEARSCHVGFEDCCLRAQVALGRGYGAVEKFVQHAVEYFGAKKAFYLFRFEVEYWRKRDLPLSLLQEIPLPGHQSRLLLFG